MIQYELILVFLIIFLLSDDDKSQILCNFTANYSISQI